MTTTLPSAHPAQELGELRLPLEADDIRRILPHRWPMIFVDRVISLKLPNEIIGIKNVSIAEPAFEGHFPQQSVLPGIYLIESLAQLAGVLVGVRALRSDAEIAHSGGYLAGVKRFRFREQVRPGDQLRLTIVETARLGRIVEFRGDAAVGGRKVADGVLTLALVG